MDHPPAISNPDEDRLKQTNFGPVSITTPVAGRFPQRYHICVRRLQGRSVMAVTDVEESASPSALEVGLTSDATSFRGGISYIRSC